MASVSMLSMHRRTCNAHAAVDKLGREAAVAYQSVGRETLDPNQPTNHPPTFSIAPTVRPEERDKLLHHR
jgi:hypothetical protein